MRILGSKDFQPLRDSRFEHQSLLQMSHQGEPVDQGLSTQSEANLSRLCLSPFKGNLAIQREQVSYGDRSNAVAAWHPLSW